MVGVYKISSIKMEQGKIARVTDRGFGFISKEGRDKDLFFHASELNGVEFNDLKEGDEVTFEIGTNDQGEHATNISRV